MQILLGCKKHVGRERNGPWERSREERVECEGVVLRTIRVRTVRAALQPDLNNVIGLVRPGRPSVHRHIPSPAVGGVEGVLLRIPAFLSRQKDPDEGGTSGEGGPALYPVDVTVQEPNLGREPPARGSRFGRPRPPGRTARPWVLEKSRPTATRPARYPGWRKSGIGGRSSICLPRASTPAVNPTRLPSDLAYVASSVPTHSRG